MKSASLYFDEFNNIIDKILEIKHKNTIFFSGNNPFHWPKMFNNLHIDIKNRNNKIKKLKKAKKRDVRIELMEINEISI